MRCDESRRNSVGIWKIGSWFQLQPYFHFLKWIEWVRVNKLKTFPEQEGTLGRVGKTTRHEGKPPGFHSSDDGEDTEKGFGRLGVVETPWMGAGTSFSGRALKFSSFLVSCRRPNGRSRDLLFLPLSSFFLSLFPVSFCCFSCAIFMTAETPGKIILHFFFPT